MELGAWSLEHGAWSLEPCILRGARGTVPLGMRLNKIEAAGGGEGEGGKLKAALTSHSLVAPRGG